MSFKAVEIAPFGIQAAVFESWDDASDYFAQAFGHQIQNVERFCAFCAKELIDGSAWFFMVIPDDLPVWKLAHECVHLADFVMDEVGVPTDVSNSELRAYLVDSIMQQVLDAER